MLLAPRELVGEAFRLLSQSKLFEKAVRLFQGFLLPRPCLAQGKGYVFAGGKLLDQKVKLEDETNGLVAQSGTGVVVGLGQGPASEKNLTGLGPVE